MAETIEEIQARMEDARKRELASWVSHLVDSNETARDSEYKTEWEENFRAWLVRFGSEDRTRKSERSRLVSPSIMAAVDATVAELEEALLNKPEFVDLRDDEVDLYANRVDDIEQVRRLVNYDLESVSSRKEFAKALLIGAIFGTGAIKGIVSFEEELELPTDRNSEVGNPVKKLKVRPVALRPDKIVLDEDAECAEDMSFWAYVDYLPRDVLKSANPEAEITRQIRDQYFVEDPTAQSDANTAKYIEFYGLVPANLLQPVSEEQATAVSMDISSDLDGEEQVSISIEADESRKVEAIVKIANDGEILSAEENPFWMKDRLMTAFRYEVVPGRFWGRGIPSKGSSPHKALSSMLRAQMDSLAYTVYPMIGVNVNKMALRGNFTIRPGQQIPFTDNPADAMTPIRFGNIDPTSFTQTGNLESMVQSATGSLEAIGPTTIDPSRASTGGIGMVSSSIVKRAARPIRTAGDELIAPFAAMVARIHMQFDKDRYPLVDLRFKASAGLGLVAKELAKQEILKTLQMVPQGSPAFWNLLKSAMEMSSVPKRDELLKSIDQMIQAAANPQPTPEQQIAAAQLELAQRNAKVQEIRAAAELERIITDRQKANADISLKDTQSLLNIAKAEGEEVGTQLNQYQSFLDEVKASVKESTGDDDTRGASESLSGAIQDSGLGADAGDVDGEV